MGPGEKGVNGLLSDCILTYPKTSGITLKNKNTSMLGRAKDNQKFKKLIVLLVQKVPIQIFLTPQALQFWAYTRTSKHP